jgi:hypothetical protein
MQGEVEDNRNPIQQEDPGQARVRYTRDPSIRLKSGSGQDDAGVRGVRRAFGEGTGLCPGWTAAAVVAT